MSAAGGLRLRVTSGAVPAAGRAWLQPPASHLGNGAVNWHLPPNAFRQLRVSCKPPPRGVHLCGSIRSPDGCFPEMRREGVARSWGSWCLTPTACPQQPQLLSGRLFGDPPHDGSHGIQHCQWARCPLPVVRPASNPALVTPPLPIAPIPGTAAVALVGAIPTGAGASLPPSGWLWGAGSALVALGTSRSRGGSAPARSLGWRPLLPAAP